MTIKVCNSGFILKSSSKTVRKYNKDIGLIKPFLLWGRCRCTDYYKMKLILVELFQHF